LAFGNHILQLLTRGRFNAHDMPHGNRLSIDVVHQPDERPTQPWILCREQRHAADVLDALLWCLAHDAGMDMRAAAIKAVQLRHQSDTACALPYLATGFHQTIQCNELIRWYLDAAGIGLDAIPCWNVACLHDLA